MPWLYWSGGAYASSPSESLAPLLERVLPAVVTIRVQGQHHEPIELLPGVPPREPRLQPFRSGGTGIIFDADRLMEQAANAFLKTLEEPPRDSTLLLVSAYPDQLLETILSRCIEVPLRPTERRQPTERQQQLLRLLGDFAKVPNPGMPQTLTLARQFQALLAQAKEAITDETDAAFKAEEKRYKQTSGATGD